MKIKSAILFLIVVMLLGACGKSKSVYLAPVEKRTYRAEELKIPEEGLKAEMATDWEEAARIYRQKLKEDTNRPDLWLRLADIEAHLNNLKGSASALQKAASILVNDAGVYYRLSQVFSMMDDPVKALYYIEKAVELNPSKREYLEARAKLANWVGKPKIAADSYRRLAEIYPGDDDIIVNLARADAWSGNLDQAVRGYRAYLRDHPQEKEIHIEYIRTEIWRGNYPRALKLLERYQKSFGHDADFLKTKADALARAGRSTLSLKLLNNLLANAPDNYELLYSKTIALHYDNQAKHAFKLFKSLQSLRPDSKETDDLWRFIKTPYRSHIQPYLGYYFDSDDLSILSSFFKAEINIATHGWLTAGGGYDYLRANIDSPFRNIDGSRDAEHYYAWVGGRLRLLKGLNLSGYIGTARAEKETTTPIYEIRIDMPLTNTFHLNLARRYGYFIISPRAVSLGIKKTVNVLNVNWDFSLRNRLVLRGSLEDFSDGNSRWEAIFFPRSNRSRTEKLNLDIGFRGWWFGYDRQLGNGYWDPEFFQSYMGAVIGYWKINEENGLSFQLAAGVLKDDSMPDFVFGYSIDSEGIFGIYKNIMLKLRASYLHNVRQPSGAFDAYLFTISLMVRL